MGSGRHRFGEPDVPPHHAARTDHGLASKNLGSGVDGDIVLHGGVTLDPAQARALLDRASAQGHPLIDAHVVANHSGFADHHPGPVIDEKVTADARARMDIDTRPIMGVLAHDPGDQRHLPQIEFVGDAVDRKGPDGRVGDGDFIIARGSWVSREGGRHILGDQFPQPDQGPDESRRDRLRGARGGQIDRAKQRVEALGHHRNLRTQFRAIELKSQQALGAIRPIDHFLGIHDAPANRLGERVFAAAR